MGKSKVGERYSVSIELALAGTGESKENVLYNDASLQVFELSVPMNALPTGRATIVSDAADVGNPGSGSYGKLMFNGLTLDGKMMEIPIYVNTLNRTNVSQDIVSLEISFTVGTEKLQCVMEPVALEGTSVDAANRLFTAQGIEIMDDVSPAKGPNGVSDNMIWRFVAGTLTEHLRDVVERSSLPGDLLYWTYDDSALTFRCPSSW